MLELIQLIDKGFVTFIFIPMIILLLFAFHILKKDTRRMHCLYTLCLVLVAVFLIRLFLSKFIFTPVNYSRFTKEGYFPLIRALFYR